MEWRPEVEGSWGVRSGGGIGPATVHIPEAPHTAPSPNPSPRRAVLAPAAAAVTLDEMARP